MSVQIWCRRHLLLLSWCVFAALCWIDILMWSGPFGNITWVALLLAMVLWEPAIALVIWTVHAFADWIERTPTQGPASAPHRSPARSDI